MITFLSFVPKQRLVKWFSDYVNTLFNPNRPNIVTYLSIIIKQAVPIFNDLWKLRRFNSTTKGVKETQGLRDKCFITLVFNFLRPLKIIFVLINTTFLANPVQGSVQVQPSIVR